MLTKSQARLFFLGGTLFFSVIFLLLTVDTLRQIPERQNSDLMTENVVRGKMLWDTNNCMGCHTILGEGAYYAPELTRVVERRGEEWIRIFLRDPQAMYPGKRKMVQYDFSEDEISDVIAFLGWIGQIDTNGFPPEPDLRPEVVVALATPAAAARGGVAGPALDGVAGRFNPAELDRWLADPTSVKPGTAMPNLRLSDELRAELVSWLTTLQ
jgi:nitric oxide reductase subunit C